MRSVLFLCTGNSARSIMAEAILNTLGKGKFTARSAGSRPVGKVNPAALSLLSERGCGTEGLRSKSWDEFEGGEAPVFDYVITVCDDAAGQSCPVRSGSPLTTHWGIPDPAAVTGSDEAIKQAFEQAYEWLEKRIREMTRLPLESMSREDLQAALDAIGRREGT